MDVEDQIVSVFSGTNGFLDDLEVSQVRAFEQGVIEHVRANHKDLLDDILATGKISDETRAKLTEAVKAFKSGFQG